MSKECSLESDPLFNTGNSNSLPPLLLLCCVFVFRNKTIKTELRMCVCVGGGLLYSCEDYRKLFNFQGQIHYELRL